MVSMPIKKSKSCLLFVFTVTNVKYVNITYLTVEDAIFDVS